MAVATIQKCFFDLEVAKRKFFSLNSLGGGVAFVGANTVDINEHSVGNI